MGEEFRTIFHEIVHIHHERLVFVLDRRIDVFGRSIGTCVEMLLQNAPYLFSAKKILSRGKRKAYVIRLLQMDMGKLREMIFYQQLLNSFFAISKSCCDCDG